MAPFISIEPRLSWYRFSEDSVDLNMIPIEAAALANISIVYGRIGGGWYILNNDLKDRFGWFALAGVELELGGLGPFGEVKYTDVSSELNAIPDIKFDMSGISVNLGLNINLGP